MKKLYISDTVDIRSWMIDNVVDELRGSFLYKPVFFITMSNNLENMCDLSKTMNRLLDTSRRVVFFNSMHMNEDDMKYILNDKESVVILNDFRLIDLFYIMKTYGDVEINANIYTTCLINPIDNALNKLEEIDDKHDLLNWFDNVVNVYEPETNDPIPLLNVSNIDVNTILKE